MAYLYRHVRLDKNEPFYVGIGGDSKGKYVRSKVKLNRNLHWMNIINKSNYKTEIILDNLTWNEACIKEIEFIKLYGRKDLGLGSLTNLTDGGEGKYGFKDSLETRIKKSNSSKGKPKNEKWKISQSLSRKGKKRGFLYWLKDNKERAKKISDSTKGKPSNARKSIIQYNLNMNLIREWDSITEAFKSLGKNDGNVIVKCCHGKRKKAYNYIWKFKNTINA